MQYLYLPQCLSCKHFYGNGCCKAYPDGVPEKIKNSSIDHRKPYQGDNGITFKLGKNKSLPEIFQEFDNKQQ